MVNILVTGSNGYIGRNLVARLLEMNHTVFEYDVSWNGHDILDAAKLEYCVKDCRIVYHLAAISGVKPCDQNRELAYRINVLGTENVLDTAEKWDVKPVLFSSQAIYGTSYYGALKKNVEQLGKNRAVILRLSNVYGGLGYEQKRNALWHFQHDDPITVYDGGQSRDFVHISQVLDKCVEAINLPYGTYNVESGLEIPIKTLAQMFAAARNVSIQFVEDGEPRLKLPAPA